MTEVKFRNEQFRGSGIRDVYKVMKFELCELRNAIIDAEFDFYDF